VLRHVKHLFLVHVLPARRRRRLALFIQGLLFLAFLLLSGGRDRFLLLIGLLSLFLFWRALKHSVFIEGVFLIGILIIILMIVLVVIMVIGGL
jgi:O-antigen ligase